jgi:hypothetical protein
MLSPEESRELANLVRASDLYSGGNTGFDPRARDGTFEVLTVTCCGRKDTVALVASGNDTFERGPRGQLVDLLHRWQMEMLKGAARPDAPRR